MNKQEHAMLMIRLMCRVSMMAVAFLMILEVASLPFVWRNRLTLIIDLLAITVSLLFGGVIFAGGRLAFKLIDDSSRRTSNRKGDAQ